MNEPIKIIHKYKNHNRKIQFNVLIFVGNLISDPINKVLQKIKNKNLYDSLIEINERDIDLINKEYGIKWYKYFFIDKHINHTFDKIIKSNEIKKKEIIKKYGKEWYELHIENYSEISKTIYSFQSTFKNDKEQKLKSQKIKLTTNETINHSYKINNKQTVIPTTDNLSNNNQTVMPTYNNQTVMSTYNNLSEDVFDNKVINNLSDNLNQKQEQEQDNVHDSDIVDEFDIEELEKIGNTDIIYDNNVDQINKTLHQLIDKTILEEKNDKFGIITKWDNTKDNNMYEEELINVYTKIYIYNQYIYLDDTIKVIRNKIICGYEKSKEFDNKTPYFIPSRIYLWSEYSYYDISNILKIDNIMLGHKWVKRNELLEIDIIPNENIRVYETLHEPLKSLQESIKKYSSRITHENDEQLILSDYNDYMTNNEIYMIDVYNELGQNYQISQELINNLYDVYIKIYYYGISREELKNIIEYLNFKNKSDLKILESTKINLVYKNIQNDLLMDNEIFKTIEELKKTPDVYNNIFKENYITHSVIHINIKHQNFKGSPKIELYRIFDNFIVNEMYPFIQYQTPEGKLVFKYYSLGTENDKDLIISKWFENAPYGISFKINVEQKEDKHNKYIAISLNVNGRMDYKNQWKEEDKATINNINETYDKVRNLLRKINIENTKLKVEIPINEKFKFAFINTIQQLELPENFLISHNDLSDFARFFYPYVAVVVEPRKRQSKILKKNEKSKYGTYLRYKRISKYENEISLEKRILYFLKNYEFNEKLLSLEISKQFNITDKQSIEKIYYVIEKTPNLKKSRNILKKFENIPKYKLPGIGIDIQGKQRDKYKMRINGARSQKQLNGIIHFMNILLYLYIETYLYKLKIRQPLISKLESLINIAKRRNKVEDIHEITETVKTVKQITKLDKERLAYKPEKGQNQWTRNCQNSSHDKKRRPIPYTDNNIDDMIKSGYIYNTKTGDYEKKLNPVANKNKNKLFEQHLKAAKISNYDGKGNSIYYTCDPAENGEYKYVGFLSRSANPYGLCMPCCFKKDPAISKNKDKKDYHLKCLGKLLNESKSKKIIGDKLYILHDSNKIQDGRFGYLPDYLDLFLNTMLNKDKIIKNNYLTGTNNGWFFKYGSKQDDDIFLTAIGDALDLTVKQIKDKITQTLINESNAESIFVSLNNGDIKTQFGTISAYIRFLHTNFELDYVLVSDIMSIPGVITDHGINIIIFEKKIQLEEKEIEKKTTKDDFNVLCVNIENIHYFLNPNKLNLIILKEDLNYYPIYQVKKKENLKNINVERFFEFSLNPDNVINHLYKYININYSQNNLELSFIDNAKTTFLKMEKYKMLSNFPTKQIIDKRNKCKYFIIQNKYLLPIRPSGALFWIPVDDNYLSFVNDIQTTSDIIYEIYLNSNKEIKIKPLGIYYSTRDEKSYFVEALIISKYINIPIIPTNININEIITYAKKYKIKEFLTESKSIYDVIDNELINYNPNNIITDKRILEVNNENFINEGYELFRLELAYYFKDQEKLRERIIKLLSKDNITKLFKKNEIKKILFKLISKQLYDIYSNIKTNVDDDIIDNNDNKNNDNTDETTLNENSDYLDDTDLIPINIVELLNNNDVNDDTQKGGTTIPNNLEEYDPLNTDIDNLQMFINPNRRLVTINNNLPNLTTYNIQNNREICPTNTKDMCETKPHCKWSSGSCLFNTTTTQIIKYVNKISEELTNNELKSNELLSKENYFVSDIVNKDFYTNRTNQKIIKSNNNNIKKILSELFGKNNVPIIGKRRMNKINTNINENNLINPLEIIGHAMYQIVHLSNPIYRAFSNCYFWIRNNMMETIHRNLGYYTQLQTELTNYFKSQVIDWIINTKNQKMLLNDLGKMMNLDNNNFINDLKKYLTRSNENLKSYIIDIYILSKINKYIIVLYDNFDNIIGIFDNGLIYLANYYENNDIKKYSNNSSYINIKYNITNFLFTNSPNIISSIYYN